MRWDEAREPWRALGTALLGPEWQQSRDFCHLALATHVQAAAEGSAVRAERSSTPGQGKVDSSLIAELLALIA